MNTLSVEDALTFVGREDLVKSAAALNEDYSFTSRDATYISCVKASVKQASDSEVAECDKYARFWNIKADVDAARKQLAGVKVAEADDSVFAMVRTHGDRVVRKYAAYDKDSTVKAACALYDNRHRYPLEWRRDTAVQLLKRASTYGAHLPDYTRVYLHKVAGLGFVSPQAAQDAYAARLVEVGDKDPELTAKLGSVLCAFEDCEDLCVDEQFVKQAMDVLDQYDTQTGFVSQYGTLPMPEDIIADDYTAHRLEKVAAAAPRPVQLTNGAVFDTDRFTPEALAAVDPGLTKLSQEQLVEVLPTLPKGDADLLARLV